MKLKRHMYSAVFAVVVSSSAAATFGGQETAREILRKSRTEGERTPMRADMYVTMWKPGKTISYVAKVALADQGRYRIQYETPPESKGRLLISDGKQHVQIDPASKAIVGAQLSPLSDALTAETARLIEENYTIRLVSDAESTASRDCFLIELASKYPGRGTQRRWIDRETYRTLRVESRTANKTLTRVVAYRDIEFPNSIADATFHIPVNGKKLVIRKPADSIADPAKLKKLAAEAGLAYAPKDGYKLIQAKLYHSSPREDQQFIYSNGIGMLSVFVARDTEIPDRGSEDWRPISLSNRPACLNTSGHANALIWSHGGRRYTVVSHMQAPTLTSLAAKLEAHN